MNMSNLPSTAPQGNRTCELPEIYDVLLQDFAPKDEPSKDLGKTMSSAHILVRWQIASFMRTSLLPSKCLEHVFILNGHPEHVQGLTCAEYAEERWPSHASKLLHHLTGVLVSVRSGWEYSRVYELDDLTGSIKISISGKRPVNPDNDLETVNIKADGPRASIAELVECLTWLACAVRPSEIDQLIQQSHAHVDVSGVGTQLHCHIHLDRLVFHIDESAKLSWHKCTKHAVIAPGKLIRPKINSSWLQYLYDTQDRTAPSPIADAFGSGLEISLIRLINVSKTFPANLERGNTILLGMKCFLYPVARLADGSFQWQVHREETDELVSLETYYELLSNEDVTERTQIKPPIKVPWDKLEQAPRHFVG